MLPVLNDDFVAPWVQNQNAQRVAGVMGLMSVWVGGLEEPCTGYFGANPMNGMQMTAATEHPLKDGELHDIFNFIPWLNLSFYVKLLDKATPDAWGAWPACPDSALPPFKGRMPILA
jgi:hypothetical protein